jgi:hypothetical protein
MKLLIAIGGGSAGMILGIGMNWAPMSAAIAMG